MTRIQGSVGNQGDNLDADVRLVQRLLNEHNLAPLAKLPEDGRASPATIASIRHFQARYVGVSSPDGRVDPGGRTLRVLARRGSERGQGQNAETRKADREMRAKYVDPRVKEIQLTTQIIDKLVPHLVGIRAKIIAGYLSDSDQFWKVNYHWEYLLAAVDHSLTLPIPEDARKDLQGIRSQLLGCKPNPASGYTSGAVGKPEDRSSYEEATKRHKILSQCKRVFKQAVERADIKAKSKRSAQVFDLAAAPVASPGTSKHGAGYALDIQGDNSAIKNVCKSQGATLIFDEQSHIHVEFKNGL
jgi:peptidoglycan hydrolase-like protein with peptidoglycan-binding domain